MSSSTPLTRWGGPGAMIWAGLMLSAWVHTDKLDGSQAGAGRLAAVLLAVPALQLVLLVGLRKVLAGRGGAQRGADLLLLWLMTFLFGLHAAVLATAIGLLDSIGRAVPVAVSLLMLGIAPGLAALEPGSPLGIRTPATLRSEMAWKTAHRFAALVFGVAGLLAPLGLFFRGLDALYVTVTPALFAVFAAIVRAMRVRVEVSEGPGRPTADITPDDDSVDRAP